MGLTVSEPVTAATVWTINETDDGMNTNTHIQSIIDNAQAGDTILFTGPQYTHIHLSINKPLNIISTVGTQIYSCPMEIPVGADDYTAFVIYNGASGTNISGFKINNNDQGYGITISNTTQINVFNNSISTAKGIGVNIIDSNGIKVKNNTLLNSNSGIRLTNSNLTNILNNIITNNNEDGILFGKNVSHTLIEENNISSNLFIGINLLESCNNTTIKNNYISLNYNRGNDEGRGIYINTLINGLNITGNFIYKNGDMGIYDDIGTTPDGFTFTEDTQNIENNYINGHTFRDVVRYVNESGDAVRKELWLKDNCFGGAQNLCPSAHILSEATMSTVSQISPGKYSISFIDTTTGNICTGFNSFYVNFFLNKNNTNKGGADTGDVWQEILVKNGTAIVDFSKYTYKNTNNTIFAVAPYTAFNSALKRSYNISDSDIPTKLNLSTSTTITPSTFKNGDSVVYKVTVKNSNSRNAAGVKVSNILSSTYFTSSAKPARGTYSNGVWNIGTLKAGETLSLSISAKAIRSGITTSRPTVTGTNINNLYSNTIQKNIAKYIKLTYKNSASSYKIKRGKYVYLATQVINSGKDKSGAVKIKITLPKGMKLAGTNYLSYYNKNTKTWTVYVPAGKSYKLQVKAKVTTKGTKKITFNINGKNYYKYIKGY
ncbi:right-handed parallel beta-helix repeat-containing protein [Methanobacterium alcaliphilum]|uniref:right-handed parallel beta-helix repeat-containing protein n=1 Tax=Methanobacterium alcaliphilum TaxID=392018 RepID=UPI00200B7627|nr:right-handed parallel beta-helix repeat-containing protein [Methanobacterium alcaliphilum]MCK9151891.1 right-handed parallel beta-helix repeat-containing protein [Methanobacterium alcaliphilum]